MVLLHGEHVLYGPMQKFFALCLAVLWLQISVKFTHSYLCVMCNSQWFFSAVNLAGCIVGDIQLNFATASSLDFAAIFISLGVNLTATMIIGLKVWYDSRIWAPPLFYWFMKLSNSRYHHRATRILYSTRKNKISPTIIILLLLIESGILFCIVQESIFSFSPRHQKIILYSFWVLYFKLFKLIQQDYPCWVLPLKLSMNSSMD